jgi:hypothetical protein
MLVRGWGLRQGVKRYRRRMQGEGRGWGVVRRAGCVRVRQRSLGVGIRLPQIPAGGPAKAGNRPRGHRPSARL